MKFKLKMLFRPISLTKSQFHSQEFQFYSQNPWSNLQICSRSYHLWGNSLIFMRYFYIKFRASLKCRRLDLHDGCISWRFRAFICAVEVSDNKWLKSFCGMNNRKLDGYEIWMCCYARHDGCWQHDDVEIYYENALHWNYFMKIRKRSKFNSQKFNTKGFFRYKILILLRHQISINFFPLNTLSPSTNSSLW